MRGWTRAMRGAGWPAPYAEIVAHDDDLAWYGSMPGQIVGWGESSTSIREVFEGLLGISLSTGWVFRSADRVAPRATGDKA